MRLNFLSSKMRLNFLSSALGGNVLGAHAQQRCTGVQDVASVWRVQPAQAIEQRCLSCAVGADQRNDLPRRYAKAHPVQCHDTAERHENFANVEQQRLVGRRQRLRRSGIVIGW